MIIRRGLPGVALFATESEPDEVDRGAHTEQEADEHEPVVVGVEPAIKAVADAAPDQKA